MQAQTKPYASRSSHDEVYYIWAANIFAENRSASGFGALGWQAEGQTATELRTTAGSDPRRGLGEVDAGDGATAVSPGTAWWPRRKTAAVPRLQHPAHDVGPNCVAQILRPGGGLGGHRRRDGHRPGFHPADADGSITHHF